CRTVAFPALSTGVYGYPPELAAPVAVRAVRELEDRFDEIRFVFLDEAMRDLFAQASRAG
ncbi:MAG TPA: macro domain-containing protein, partial [Gaiellaceae bacterium]|nr:macro domain-containing protein [Gaiellaceae bacterium]